MSWIAIEYWCPSCRCRFDSLESRSDIPSRKPHRVCGTPSDRAISAPLPKVQLATVTRGKSDPPPANVIDTRPLADGMPVKEWRRQYRAKRRRRIQA